MTARIVRLALIEQRHFVTSQSTFEPRGARRPLLLERTGRAMLPQSLRYLNLSQSFLRRNTSLTLARQIVVYPRRTRVYLNPTHTIL